MRRERFGRSSERGAHLEQLELELADLEADLAEDEVAAETAAGKANTEAYARRKPARGPLPAHLPRERVVIAAPSACPCCGWP